MKEAVIYKILRYRQNRCHTNEERWIDHSWHKAKNQHSQQCQSVFTVESQDNIPDCTNTHIIKTTLPIPLPGVKKLLHNINTHRYCVPKTIKLFGFPIFWSWATWWRLFQKRFRIYHIKQWVYLVFKENHSCCVFVFLFDIFDWFVLYLFVFDNRLISNFISVFFFVLRI
jgi:hypothetical protein